MNIRLKAVAGLILAAALAVLPTRARADATGDAPMKTYVTAPQGSLSLSGAMYLFGYAPAMPGGSNNFDLYAFILNIDGATNDGQNGVHAQMRLRDTKLRPYFNSNVWFQELYGYHKTPVGEVHVGKFYRKVGLLWDDSFFGNIQYFNGLKLNPDYGVELVGSKKTPMENVAVGYSAQYLPNNDSTSGAVAGRSIVDDPYAKLKNTVTARVAPSLGLGGKNSLALGLSGLRGSVQRSTSTSGNFGLSQEAADLTLTYGPSVTYVEILNQNGELDNASHPLSRPGYDRAVYLLAGTRWQVHPRVNVRFNYSSANYVGQNAREEEYVPGFNFDVTPNATLIAEFDYWRLLPRSEPQSLIDRSYNIVARYTF